MLGPGILGAEEFARQKAEQKVGDPTGLALNVLGPAFRQETSAEHALVQNPAPATDDLRVSAKKALELLKKNDAGTRTMVLAAELSRSAATRRRSVLEALLDAAVDDGEREKLSAALHETNTAQALGDEQDEG